MNPVILESLLRNQLGPFSPFLAKVWNSFKSQFALDLRSLALLRIGLALLILGDLGVRCSDLKAHYTDLGVLPRSVAIEKLLGPWDWSLHLLGGSAFLELLLFLIAAIAALALLLGYRTRLATIVSWILLISLQNRNPLVLNGGDIEFHLLLFWSIFLPLGHRYSLDRALQLTLQIDDSSSQNSFFSAATLAYTLQICLIYWCAWASKTDPIWRVEGTAVYYALSIDQLVTPIGKLIYPFPLLMKIFSFSTLWFEALGPFLLFIPYKNHLFRNAAVFLFITLHMGFHLSLCIGLFGFIGAIAWLAFIPAQVWDRMTRRLKNQQQTVTLHYASNAKIAAQVIQIFLILPHLQTVEVPDSTEAHQALALYLVNQNGETSSHRQLWKELAQISPLKHYLNFFLFKCELYWLFNKLLTWLNQNSLPLPRKSKLRFWTQQGFVSLCLVCVVLWNGSMVPNSHIQFPNGLYSLTVSLKLDQRWDMFSPFPLTEDGWYMIPATLRDGTTVDLFQQGQPVTWQKPLWVSQTYKNEHWRKYMMNLWMAQFSDERLYYGRYLCRQWNEHHSPDRQLETFQILFMLERTLPDYQVSPIESIELWNHHCFDRPQG
jgi:hypothetical protein